MMNHLDVGFDGINPIVGFAYNVVNKYFDVCKLGHNAGPLLTFSRCTIRTPSKQRLTFGKYVLLTLSSLSSFCLSHLFTFSLGSLLQLPGPERLIYTTHPWLVSLYLDCPSNSQWGSLIHCPNAR
jgi:hypothetical protein